MTMTMQRTLAFDWDTRIARQRYIGAVSRACFTPGFTFLRFETFTCGGQRHDVAIFRNNLFAEALGLAKAGEAEWLPPSTTDIAAEFVLIPEGTFLMGTFTPGNPLDEDLRGWPQHQVDVPPFLMARTQCTQDVWGDRNRQRREHPRLPANVSWYNIQDFERATGLRLPSEAEWEYACRAGTTTRFSFGDDGDLLGDYAWYNGNSSDETHPVGVKRPNAFGLYDMHGNVWEWCEDRWHIDYDGAPTDGSAWTDGDSVFRIIRGGNGDIGAWGCRSDCRDKYPWIYLHYGLGFRPACSIGGDE